MKGLKLNTEQQKIYEAFLDELAQGSSKEDLEAELEEAKEHVTEIEARLASIDQCGDEVAKTIVALQAALGDKASAETYIYNLRAKFGVPEPRVVPVKKAKKTNGKSTGKVSTVTTEDDLERMVIDVLTSEAQRSPQVSAAIASATGKLVDSKTLGPVFKKLLEEGRIQSEGERRGRGYFV